MITPNKPYRPSRLTSINKSFINRFNNNYRPCRESNKEILSQLRHFADKLHHKYSRKEINEYKRYIYCGDGIRVLKDVVWVYKLITETSKKNDYIKYINKEIDYIDYSYTRRGKEIDCIYYKYSWAHRGKEKFIKDFALSHLDDPEYTYL